MPESTERHATTTEEHDAAMRWLDANPGALADYVGEWVAIADDRVLAHGEQFDEVVGEAERQGFADPLLVPVLPYPFIGL